MTTPRNGRAAMLFIAVTIFLDVLGLGLIIPVLPHLVTDLAGGDASRGAEYYGFIAASFAAMQFIFAPVLGALSDRFGRRPVILLALFGFGVNYVLLGLAPSLAWLFAARLLSGVTGASFTAANAYIADISTPETRAKNFGVVGAMFGLGFIAGPAIGGLLGHFGPRMPFFVAAGVVFVNFLYGLFVLPESLPPGPRRAFTLQHANPFTSIAQLGRYPLVAGLAAAFVFVSLAQRGLESVWVIYTQYRFGWLELQNGMGMALVGVMAAVVQGGLIRRIVPRLGERRSIVVGLAIATVSFVLYGLSAWGWMMLAVVVVGALGGIAAPAIQGLVSGSVPAAEQGAVQGTFTALMSLTAIAAPLIASQGFAYFTSPRAPFALPGAPFFVGALFMATSLVLVWRLFRRFPATQAVVVADPQANAVALAAQPQELA